MTIEIPISPDYRLTSDVHNIIVNERYFTDPTKAPGWARRLAENPDADPTAGRALARSFVSPYD
nr:hypothetical protein [Bacillus pumilus]